MNTKRSWYSSKSNLSADYVHQILMFGTLLEIESLKKTVGINTVKKLFLSQPKKIYTASSLNFIKNFMLHISESVDEKKYLKHPPRNTR